MLKSGYNREERDQIVYEGRARYSNLLAKVTRGERPLYRNAPWMKERRGMEMVKKHKGWHGGADTVLFVQSTPNEILRKEIQGQMDKLGMKVKVVEKAGRSLKSLLQVQDAGLMTVLSARLRQRDSVACRTWGYLVWRKECELQGVWTVMHGETGRCARIRCGERERALLKTNSNL